jgi:hypothetical protein
MLESEFERDARLLQAKEEKRNALMRAIEAHDGSKETERCMDKAFKDFIEAMQECAKEWC